MKEKNITIYDVAEEAGVSLATVSRVINGSTVVKESTKKKVLEVIEKLDYRPNQVARGLATSKSTMIAIVFPESLFAHVKNMISGISDISRTLDYNVSIYTVAELGDGDAFEDIANKIIKSRADGVVLFNDENLDKEVELMKNYNIPTVVIGDRMSDDNLCSIYVDAKDIAYSLTKSYLDKGIDDLVFVKTRQNLVNLDHFLYGIVKAYNDAGKTFDESHVIHTSTHYEKSYPQFKEYFSTHKHQVVLTGYDKEAVAVVNAAIDHHISIPDEMEVIGLMDTSYAIMSRPSLTSIHVPVYEMGAMAIRLITKMLNDELIEEKEVAVVHQLIQRDSTKELL